MDTPPNRPRPIPPRPIPPRPIPPSARPPRDYAAEEEYGRRVTAANIQFRRGLVSEAEAAAKALLAEKPTDAAVSELLGDIAETRGDWDAAIASYQAALAAEPGRATAEAKIGRAVLRRAEQQRQKTLGVAYAATDASLMRRAAGERPALWAILGSAVCPGLGQIVQGQTIKGGVMAGVFLLGVVLLTQVHGTGHAYFTPAFWTVLVLLAADWIYAVADASAAR